MTSRIEFPTSFLEQVQVKYNVKDPAAKIRELALDGYKRDNSDQPQQQHRKRKQNVHVRCYDAIVDRDKDSVNFAHGFTADHMSKCDECNKMIMPGETGITCGWEER